MRQCEFHKCKEGLGQLTVNDRLTEYGANFIKISVPPVLYLVFHEVGSNQNVHDFDGQSQDDIHLNRP